MYKVIYKMISDNGECKLTRNINQEDLGKLLLRKDVVLISAAEAGVVYRNNYNNRRKYCKKGKRWYN